MGLSIRAYARHRGVSHVAVKKAIDSGRITTLPDGTIDPDQADAQWTRNTEAPRAGARTRPVLGAVPPEAAGSVPVGDMPTGLPTGGTSLLQARTVNEVIKAQTNKVRLARLKGELIDRHQAIAHVFKLARAERDAWLNWPARVSAQMAARLGVDAHALHVALETAVREHLQELGEVRPQVD
ncbi:elements of external origin [Sulfurivermis fontis]|uniref:elements of external origin n=1 Tax=Sulfurivermis fontis TaxID=1972068 RepID=UPI000FD6E728